jgi:hypothetical protein
VCVLLVDCADAEFEVADVRVRALFSQGSEDLFFLECELLDDDRTHDGDFEHAAFDAAGQGVGGEGFASSGTPGGREVGGCLDAAVATGGDQLGEDVFDRFRFAGMVSALLALAAKCEVGSGLGVGVNGCGSMAVVDGSYSAWPPTLNRR